MNNYEKIKAMTLDEIAEYLSCRSTCTMCIHQFKRGGCKPLDCADRIKLWLQQESEVLK